MPEEVLPWRACQRFESQTVSASCIVDALKRDRGMHERKAGRMTIFAIIIAGLMIGYLCSLIKQKEDEDE